MIVSQSLLVFLDLVGSVARRFSWSCSLCCRPAIVLSRPPKPSSFMCFYVVVQSWSPLALSCFPIRWPPASLRCHRLLLSQIRCCRSAMGLSSSPCLSYARCPTPSSDQATFASPFLVRSLLLPRFPCCRYQSDRPDTTVSSCSTRRSARPARGRDRGSNPRASNVNVLLICSVCMHVAITPSLPPLIHILLLPRFLCCRSAMRPSSLPCLGYARFPAMSSARPPLLPFPRPESPPSSVPVLSISYWVFFPYMPLICSVCMHTVSSFLGSYAVVQPGSLLSFHASHILRMCACSDIAFASSPCPHSPPSSVPVLSFSHEAFVSSMPQSCSVSSVSSRNASLVCMYVCM
jgi:hypothetical protein